MAKEIAREDNEFLADLLSHTPDVRTFHQIVNDHNDRQSARQILSGGYSKPLRNLPIDPETDTFLPALLAEYDSTIKTIEQPKQNQRRINWPNLSLGDIGSKLFRTRTGRALLTSAALAAASAGIYIGNRDSFEVRSVHAQTVPTEGPVSTAEIPTIQPAESTATPEIKPTNTQVPPTEQPSQVPIPSETSQPSSPIPSETPRPSETSTPIPTEQSTAVATAVIPSATLPPPPTEAPSSTTEPTSFPTSQPAVTAESKPTNTIILPSVTPSEIPVPPSAQPTLTPAFTSTPIPPTETAIPSPSPTETVPPQERRRPPSATSTPVPSEVPILPPTEVLTPPTSQPVVPREQPTQVPRMSVGNIRTELSAHIDTQKKLTEVITIGNQQFTEGEGWKDGTFIKFTSGNGTEVLGAHYYSSQEFLKAKNEAIKNGYSEKQAKEIAFEYVVEKNKTSQWGKLLQWLAENPGEYILGTDQEGNQFMVSDGRLLNNTPENQEFNLFIDQPLGSNQRYIYTCADLEASKVFGAVYTNLGRERQP